MKITSFNKLRKFESYLYTAKYGNYIRSLTMPQVNELTAIGAELNIPYKHKGCPKCMLDFVKKLANPYFEQKEKLEQKKKEKGNEDNGQKRSEGQRQELPEADTNGSQEVLDNQHGSEGENLHGDSE